MKIKWKHKPEPWEGKAVWIAVVVMILVVIACGAMVYYGSKGTTSEHWWRNF